jgi:hypothetical protein
MLSWTKVAIEAQWGQTFSENSIDFHSILLRKGYRYLKNAMNL